MTVVLACITLARTHVVELQYSALGIFRKKHILCEASWVLEDWRIASMGFHKLVPWALHTQYLVATGSVSQKETRYDPLLASAEVNKMTRVAYDI